MSQNSDEYGYDEYDDYGQDDNDNNNDIEEKKMIGGEISLSKQVPLSPLIHSNPYHIEIYRFCYSQ